MLVYIVWELSCFCLQYPVQSICLEGFCRKFRKPPFGNGWFQIGAEGGLYIFAETMQMENMSLGHAAKTTLTASMTTDML